MSLRPAGRRPNLPATIATRLRAQIVSGELPPGAKLPGHRDLAAAHAVSVGSMRPSVESHRRLLEAIADGDPARAAEVADEIVSRNQKFVLGLYALGHSTEAAGG